MRLKFTQFIVCLAIICYGIYSGLMLVENNQKVSQIIGSYKNLSSISEDIQSTYSLRANDFKAVDDSLIEFSLTREFAAEKEFDGTDKEYLILVNDGLCQDVTSNKGQVQGIYSGIFLNPDGSVAMEDSLTVTIEYYLNQKTVLTITTHGGSEAVSFWAQYISKFGMMLQVVEI